MQATGTLSLRELPPSEQRQTAQIILLWQRIEKGACCAPRCEKNAPKRLVCGAADCRAWLRALDHVLAEAAEEALRRHMAGTLGKAPQVTYSPLAMVYL